MSDPLTRIRDDKYLRDAARTLVDADIQHLRYGLTHQGLTGRVMGWLKDGASEVYEEALDVAADNKGALAALLAAVALWFARNPLLSLFGIEHDESDEDDA
ncbi:hypothetical protein [Qipengyuania marisflavi]|uniref:Uncharacterized protein n=1 Tax=Qipengyuania marisflavi TaxID=2486356 RepID=A0A5S3PAR3_9SPHN|nr:hypothetical protein [Qipengyuania marisflavi]TMM49835.1 hypothetical protein FEV51_01135 [Qipengyuania marisflavi]